MGLLKQRLDDALEGELVAQRYLNGVVALAEKTTQERDQLMLMVRRAARLNFRAPRGSSRG